MLETRHLYFRNIITQNVNTADCQIHFSCYAQILIQGYAAPNTSVKEVILLVVSNPCLHTAVTLICLIKKKYIFHSRCIFGFFLGNDAMQRFGFHTNKLRLPGEFQAASIIA